MNRIITCALITLLCLACRHKGGPRTLLKLQYYTGEKIDVKFRQYTIKDGNVDDPVNNEYVRLGFTVDSAIHDSLYALSAKIDYIRIQDKGFMNGQEYASDADEAAVGPNGRPHHPGFKSVIDSVYKLVISKREK
jgi:hypothetical protein